MNNELVINNLKSNNSESKSNNEEKQIIEEMAKIMDIDCGECYTCEYYESKGINCTCLLQARELYNAGYRKIPEGAVVLTKEELAQIQSNFFDAGIKHGSKATAEKFAEMAREGAFVDFMGELIIRASKIDEICKEITGGK